LSTKPVLPAPTSSSGKLASEQVILSAPMSYAGATARLWRRFKALMARIPRPAAAESTGGKIAAIALTVLGALAVYTAAVVVLLAVYVAITGWYLIFGILLVPYRLIRRGGRKRKMHDLRHREMMAAIESSKH